MEETRVVVGRYEYEFDARVAKGRLGASGISADIFKYDGGGMIPSLQNSDIVQLVVSESQGEKAKRLLRIQSD